jgi:ABC-type lipoprotein export system ATPase subunit
MIGMDGVTKVYQMGSIPVHALRGVSLQIDDGEPACIVGPCVLGKSPLMILSCCLDLLAAGCDHLHGQDVERLSDNQSASTRSAEIGFVSKQFSLSAVPPRCAM